MARVKCFAGFLTKRVHGICCGLKGWHHDFGVCACTMFALGPFGLEAYRYT